MSSEDLLVPRKTPPSLEVPISHSTVQVCAIDTTSRLDMDVGALVDPPMKGYDREMIPSYSFLVSNGTRHVLFDMGVRKDFENYSPAVVKRMGKMAHSVTVEKDVIDLLREHSNHDSGATEKNIEAIIWSHRHWDHTGAPSKFPLSTTLVVGPGFKEGCLPGYPTNQDSFVLESDWEGREFRELDIANEGQGLKIGGCDAYDYFEDGSFYLLDTPGHSAGHICGLARVSSAPASFVFMGADACHHPGEIKPTQFNPLPKLITPSPFSKFDRVGCPGEILQSIQCHHRADEPFFTPSTKISDDYEATLKTLEKVRAIDGHRNVLTIFAHDKALLDCLPLYPKNINSWYKDNLDANTRWKFCEDFEQAIEESEDKGIMRAYQITLQGQFQGH